jgi:hypothetical protein
MSMFIAVPLIFCLQAHRLATEKNARGTQRSSLMVYVGKAGLFRGV